MHILIIPSWYPATSGDLSGSFFREQAQALVRNGCQVGVIYPQLRSWRQWASAFTSEYGLSEECDGDVVTLRRHSMNWFPRLPVLGGRQWIRSAEKLYTDYVKKYGKPDLIHAQSLLHAGSAALHISQVFGVPYVVTEHSSAYQRGLVIGRQRQAAVAAAQGASQLIAVSQEFCAALSRILPETAERWTYVPNMVHERFLKVPLRMRHGGAFEFLHVSMLDPNKAVGNLIDAYAIAFGQDASVRLVIGGGGDERVALEARTKRHGINDCVSFIGALSREAILEQMQKCDAFVLQSKSETFGVVLIEALALGKPVIATRCGGPESIVGDHDGILVPVDDVKQLASALKEMRRKYNLYSPSELRRSCANRFSEMVVTDQLIEIYHQVLAEARQRTVNA